MLKSSIFEYVPHPNIAERRAPSSPKPDDVRLAHRFNALLARHVTAGVGTMWCAYLFAMFAFTGFPGFLPVSISKYALWGSTVLVS
jgi:hypothetical protein